MRYSGVASRLDATSVHLDGEGVRLLEQDYDYDLISADKLLQKHIDLGLKASLKAAAAWMAPCSASTAASWS